MDESITCEATGLSIPDSLKKLRAEMQSIINRSLPIEKESLSPKEAEELALKQGRDDIVRNLKYKNIDLYKCEEYYDYFLRQLADNSSVVRSFEILYHSPGLILRFPHQGESEVKQKFKFPKNLFVMHQEHDKWLSILKVNMVVIVWIQETNDWHKQKKLLKSTID